MKAMDEKGLEWMDGWMLGYIFLDDDTDQVCTSRFQQWSRDSPTVAAFPTTLAPTVSRLSRPLVR